MTCVNHWMVGLALVATGLAAQETPRPNRVAWFAGFPEPLPQGVTEVAVEATSQMLRPDLERSADQRTFARLDGEEWQFTGDWATQAGPGRFNVRVRVVSRSGGLSDQAMVSWHTLFHLPQGGRLDAPKNRLAYHLERDGRVIGELYRPGVALMDLDLAWVLPFGHRDAGGRVGASVQLPTGKQADFSGSGSTDGLVGAAAWKQVGPWRLAAQVERVVLGLPKDSPLRLVMDRTAFNRAWGTVGWVGDGPGLLSGLGVEVSVGYAGSPYKVGLSRLDPPGWQQHWTIRHTRWPHWRFGFSEEAGTFVAPDVTGFVAYTFGDR